MTRIKIPATINFTFIFDDCEGVCKESAMKSAIKEILVDLVDDYKDTEMLQAPINQNLFSKYEEKIGDEDDEFPLIQVKSSVIVG
jgi:FPC/CPF motif-containing protein YcgG